MGDMDDICIGTEIKELPKQILQGIKQIYMPIIKAMPSPTTDSLEKLFNREDLLPKEYQQYVDACRGNLSQAEYFKSQDDFIEDLQIFMH